MPELYLQGIVTNNVRFAFSVGDTSYMGGLQSILSKTNRISPTNIKVSLKTGKV